MEGSSKGKGKATSDRTRRAWTDTEERLLMDFLKELVKKNWKTENGFKPGYQKTLQDMMRKALPGTDIRALPHINSKIIIWKRSYGTLRGIIGDSRGSGIGFNTTTCLLDCDDEQWADAVARDPSAAHMRLKTWPMYEDWVEVFGNDRATGITAENVYDSYNNLVNEDARRSQSQGTHDSFGAQSDYNMETEDFLGVDGDSQTVEPETPPVMKASQKKRSSTSSPVDPLVDVLRQLVTTSAERLDNICRAIGFESDRTKARNEIFGMLDTMPYLTLDQKIDVSKALSKDSNEMDMFLGFTQEAQVRYVNRLLFGDEFW